MTEEISCEMCGGPTRIDVDEEQGVIEIECLRCGHEYWKEIKSPREQHMEDYPEDARARTFDGGF